MFAGLHKVDNANLFKYAKQHVFNDIFKGWRPVIDDEKGHDIIIPTFKIPSAGPTKYYRRLLSTLADADEDPEEELHAAELEFEVVDALRRGAFASWDRFRVELGMYAQALWPEQLDAAVAEAEAGGGGGGGGDGDGAAVDVIERVACVIAPDVTGNWFDREYFDLFRKAWPSVGRYSKDLQWVRPWMQRARRRVPKKKKKKQQKHSGWENKVDAGAGGKRRGRCDVVCGQGEAVAVAEGETLRHLDAWNGEPGRFLGHGTNDPMTITVSAGSEGQLTEIAIEDVTKISRYGLQNRRIVDHYEEKQRIDEQYRVIAARMLIRAWYLGKYAGVKATALVMETHKRMKRQLWDISRDRTEVESTMDDIMKQIAVEISQTPLPTFKIGTMADHTRETGRSRRQGISSDESPSSHEAHNQPTIDPLTPPKSPNRSELHQTADDLPIQHHDTHEMPDFTDDASYFSRGEENDIPLEPPRSPRPKPLELCPASNDAVEPTIEWDDTPAPSQYTPTTEIANSENTVVEPPKSPRPAKLELISTTSGAQQHFVESPKLRPARQSTPFPGTFSECQVHEGPSVLCSSMPCPFLSHWKSDSAELDEDTRSSSGAHYPASTSTNAVASKNSNDQPEASIIRDTSNLPDYSLLMRRADNKRAVPRSLTINEAFPHAHLFPGAPSPEIVVVTEPVQHSFWYSSKPEKPWYCNVSNPGQCTALSDNVVESCKKHDVKPKRRRKSNKLEPTAAQSMPPLPARRPPPKDIPATLLYRDDYGVSHEYMPSSMKKAQQKEPVIPQGTRLPLLTRPDTTPPASYFCTKRSLDDAFAIDRALAILEEWSLGSISPENNSQSPSLPTPPPSGVTWNAPRPPPFAMPITQSRSYDEDALQKIAELEKERDVLKEAAKSMELQYKIKNEDSDPSIQCTPKRMVTDDDAYFAEYTALLAEFEALSEYSDEDDFPDIPDDFPDDFPDEDGSEYQFDEDLFDQSIFLDGCDAHETGTVRSIEQHWCKEEDGQTCKTEQQAITSINESMAPPPVAQPRLRLRYDAPPPPLSPSRSMKKLAKSDAVSKALKKLYHYEARDRDQSGCPLERLAYSYALKNADDFEDLRDFMFRKNLDPESIDEQNGDTGANQDPSNIRGFKMEFRVFVRTFKNIYAARNGKLSRLVPLGWNKMADMNEDVEMADEQ